MSKSFDSTSISFTPNVSYIVSAGGTAYNTVIPVNDSSSSSYGIIRVSASPGTLTFESVNDAINYLAGRLHYHTLPSVSCSCNCNDNCDGQD